MFVTLIADTVSRHFREVVVFIMRKTTLSAFFRTYLPKFPQFRKFILGAQILKNYEGVINKSAVSSLILLQLGLNWMEQKPLVSHENGPAPCAPMINQVFKGLPEG